MTRILVAGLGNLFLGDDAFGVEVVRRMRGRPWREGVRIEDFGIRGIDLTYALLDGVDLTILVDATQRGGPPGSLYLVEPSLGAARGAASARPSEMAFGSAPNSAPSSASSSAPSSASGPTPDLPLETGPETRPPALLFSPHDMQPDQVLRAVSLLGGTCGRIVLVGCEPESFGTEGDEEGRIGLSEPVAAAIEPAIAMIEALLDEAGRWRQAERPADYAAGHA